MTTRTHGVREEIFGRDRLPTTVGIVLLISLIAFEAMGVSTAMPALVDELGSVETYAWPFVSFIASTVIGTVLAGRWCDLHGPRAVLLLGPAVFGVGLLVAGLSPVMAQLLLGRALQGLGAGAQGVAVYVLIARVYSPSSRPAVFAMLSAAWVLPSLIGPPAAGLVTERWSWHWVFLGLLPLVALAVGLLLPVVRRVGAPGSAATARTALVPDAVVAAVAVAALTWAGERPTGWRLGLMIATLVLLVVSLRRLLPAGTPRARPGIPAVVAARGLIAAAFFTASAYLPLTLTSTHGWSITAAGVPLIAGSLAWSLTSAWQGRRPELSRAVLVRGGFVSLALGIALLLLVVPTWGLPWLAFPAMALAGGGMGVGYSGLSFLVLAHSAEDVVGANSSSTMLAELTSQAVAIGLGGALLAVLSTPVAVTVIVAVLLAVCAAGVSISARTAV